ncbi:MAG: hypothetical protein AB2A00_41975 [Myxococcota bacterium]
MPTPWRERLEALRTEVAALREEQDVLRGLLRDARAGAEAALARDGGEPTTTEEPSPIP